jgi:hypothetical protein
MRDVKTFSAGAVISGGFSVYFRNLASFVPLSLLAYSPVWIGLLVFGPQNPEDAFSGGGWAMLVLGTIAAYWLQASLIYGTISTLRGGQTSLPEMLSRSLQALLAVIVVAILLTIVMTIGFVLLIVPGLILMTMFWVTIPVAVVERNGVGAAFSRSRELTSGHRWSIFGLFVVIAVLAIVVQVVMGMIFGFAGAQTVSVLGTWLTQLVSMVVSGLWACLVVVSYHDLRVIKEGVGTEQIAQVFD